MIGELLAIPSVSIIKKLEINGGSATVEREIEGGKEVLTIPLPLVAGTAEGVAEPKIPNMRGIMSARSKPLTVLEPVEVKTLSEVIRYETPVPRGQVKLVAPDSVDKLVGLLHDRSARYLKQCLIYILILIHQYAGFSLYRKCRGKIQKINF